MTVGFRANSFGLLIISYGGSVIDQRRHVLLLHYVEAIFAEAEVIVLFQQGNSALVRIV